MATHSLVRRGDQWWMQLTVPAPLRRFFLSSNGKPMRQIREPMGDSKTVAAMKANQRAAACSRVFVRLHAGEDMTPEQVRAELRNEFADDPLTLGNQWEAEAARMYREQYRILERAARFEAWGAATPPIPGAIEKMIDVTPPPAGPTITKAAEAWYLELARDSRPQTVDGHRTRVNAFAKKYNDPLLATASGTAKITRTRSTTSARRRATRPSRSSRSRNCRRCSTRCRAMSRQRGTHPKPLCRGSRSSRSTLVRGSRKYAS
jgi:hypothetical protein